MEWFMNSSTLLLTWASGPTDLQQLTRTKPRSLWTLAEPSQSNQSAKQVQSQRVWRCGSLHVWLEEIRTKMFLNNVKIREPQECTPFINNPADLYLFYYFLFLKCNLFLWWQTWIFSIITPVFTVTWSFRNHFNMLISCSRNIALIKSDSDDMYNITEKIIF